MEPDFSGWASKNGVVCSDGRTIQPGAFKHQHETRVPLVWAHKHDNPENVLGHAILDVRDEGTWIEGFFNGGTQAAASKILLEHGDVDSLSIWANNLTEANKNVIHGDIREVSLVLAGANAEAKIKNVHLQHGDSEYILEDEVIITEGHKLVHAGTSENKTEDKTEIDDDTTVDEIIENMSPEQQKAVAYIVARATGELDDNVEHSDDNKDDDHVEHGEDDSNSANGDGTDGDNLQHQEGTQMTNVFEGDAAGKTQRPTLSHDDMKSIVATAQKNGSFKQALADHLEHAGTFGINEIEELFPNAKNVQQTPEWIKRRTEWVDGIINGVNAVPFTRIRSMSADITHEEARARGYIKGNLKKEEFFGIKSRTTTPKTIYKKQKLDRDDIIDITEFDVVIWLKGEMRMMIEEEIARAILLGDGRPVELENGDPNPDKIDEEHIRPIAKDHDFYAHQVEVTLSDAESDVQEIMEAVLRSRKVYKGSGPAFYTTEDYLTDMLLSRDKMGRRHFKSVEDVASELRVSRIITVDAMEEDPTLIGILVNIKDYTVGTDKGGKLTTFEDFDIDYNQEKYLIESRLSGALTKHKTAVVFRRADVDALTATAPTIAGNTITIPTVENVDYYVGSKKVTGTYNVTASNSPVLVHAEAADTHYLTGADEWSFEHTPA